MWLRTLWKPTQSVGYVAQLANSGIPINESSVVNDIGFHKPIRKN
jgi:hypothetical protein